MAKQAQQGESGIWRTDRTICGFQRIREKILKNFAEGKMKSEDASREVRKLNAEIEKRYIELGAR